MTLYLHIGPSKTASTILQDMLSTPQPDILTYPEIGRPDKKNAHHHIAWSLSKKKPVPEEDVLQNVDAELARSENVFISSEDFPARPVMVKPVLDMAKAHGHDIIVMFVARDPVERLNSMYAQLIKTFMTDVPFKDFLNKSHEPRFQINSFMTPRWSEQVSEFWVLPYVPKQMVEVYGRLFDRLGLERTAPQRKASANRSPSAYAIELCRRYGVDNVKRQGYMRRFTEIDRELSLPSLFAPDQDDIAKIKSLYGAEIDALEIPSDFWPAEQKNKSLWRDTYPASNALLETEVMETYLQHYFGEERPSPVG